MLCTGRGEEKIMRSSYLKSYESVGSEEESGSASDAGVSDAGPSRSARKRRDGKGVSKTSRRGVPGMGAGAEKKKRKQRPRSTDESNDSWDGEEESMSDGSEARDTPGPRRRGGVAKGERKRDRRMSLEGRTNGMSSRAAEMLAKKAEILEKYKSRAHHDSGHRPDDVSKESEMDSADNGREERVSARTREAGRHRPGSVFQRTLGTHHVDDSESEINFIMDMYDRTSLNNSLKDKMFEYLTQVGKKG